MLVGYFSMTEQMPACLIDTDKKDDESIALASACPLARLSSTFIEVRLVVCSDNTSWKQDVGTVTGRPEVLRRQLARLCTVHSPSIVGDLRPKRRLPPPQITQPRAKAKRSIRPSSRIQSQSPHPRSRRSSCRRQMREGQLRKVPL